MAHHGTFLPSSNRSFFLPLTILFATSFPAAIAIRSFFSF
jgi:hypothetical protein